MSRYLLTNAAIITGTSCRKGSLGIDGERIGGIWYDCEPDFPDAETIDLDGKVLMAGGIDTHVHFREPGMTHKGDIASESEAALLGGITSFIDMPNTNPPTVSAETLESKLSAASRESRVNYGFHLGATNSNSSLIREYLAEGLGSRFGGIKVFMGSSTGDMLVDREAALLDLFSIKANLSWSTARTKELSGATLKPPRLVSEMISLCSFIRSSEAGRLASVPPPKLWSWRKDAGPGSTSFTYPRRRKSG